MWDNDLRIPIWLWIKLVWALRRVGENKRESGAFLLAKEGSNTVKEFILYTDLDPQSLDSGIVIFGVNGYRKLWKYCAKNGLQVAADVHTHPGPNTGQSYADMTHPMVRKEGHRALIIPSYAQQGWYKLTNISAYLYNGSFEWTKLSVILSMIYFKVLRHDDA